jgi:ATP-dependent RNA helicase RhlE
MIKFIKKALIGTADSDNKGFSSLSLSPEILKALSEKGYIKPTPIQEKAIPVVLRGDDIMATAQTGTGKTAGFTLPILHRLSLDAEIKGKRRPIRALILTPTRELASQILASIHTYGVHLPLRSTVVFGGVNINPQKDQLKKGVDILVATPGRLLDLHGQGAISFSGLQTLVLDEADRMLDMGFIHDIKRLLTLIPKKRQTLLFSATFSRDIQALAKRFLNHPVDVSVNPKNSTAPKVQQTLYAVDKKQKPSLLHHLISTHNWYQVLVFTRTKHGANKLTAFLNKQNIVASAIHGNKSQSARTKALADFKTGKGHVLVATDIASRGLDINELPHVVNYDLPNVPEDYVHRIGRTGRAGAEGQAVSLVSHDEFKLLSAIERLIKQKISRETLPNFEFIKTPTLESNEGRFKPKRTTSKPRGVSQKNDSDSPRQSARVSTSDAPKKKQRFEGSFGGRKKTGRR